MTRVRTAVFAVLALCLATATLAQEPITVRHPFGFGMTEAVRIRITFQRMTPSCAGKTQLECVVLLDSNSMVIGPYVFATPGEIQRFSTDNQAAKESAQFLSRTAWLMFGNIDVMPEIVGSGGDVMAVPPNHPLAAYAE